MNQLTIKKNFVPLDLSDIAHVESKFGIIFPPDLVSFFQLYQGAITYECQILWDPLGPEPDIAVLFSNFLEVKFKGKNYSIERWRENYNEMKEEGPEYDHGIWIPLASDIGSCHACYSLNPETFGQIFMYDPYGGNDAPFNFLRPTLEDFVNGLYNPYLNVTK